MNKALKKKAQNTPCDSPPPYQSQSGAPSEGGSANIPHTDSPWESMGAEQLVRMLGSVREFIVIVSNLKEQVRNACNETKEGEE
jgi:hypothetical protein